MSGKLIALWERGKHPRDWHWIMLNTSRVMIGGDRDLYGKYVPSGWTLAREPDGVEAEVYVPV